MNIKHWNTYFKLDNGKEFTIISGKRPIQINTSKYI